MISKLELKEFRAFREVEFNFATLNVVTGINSAGKSSIWEALEIYSHINDNSFLKKNIDDYINKKSTEDEFEISINSKSIILQRIPQNLYKYRTISSDIEKIEVKRLKANRYISSNQMVEKFDPNNGLGLFNECKENEQEIAQIISNIFNHSGFSVKNTSIANKVFFDIEFDNSSSIDEVGFGIKFILPILVSIMHKDFKILIIENPETHLHPDAQSKLISEIYALAYKYGKQVFIETHSDHIVNGLRKMLFIEKKENIKLYFLDPVDGKIHDIGLEGANFSIMPKGFMDQSLKDIREIKHYELQNKR